MLGHIAPSPPLPVPTLSPGNKDLVAAVVGSPALSAALADNPDLQQLVCFNGDFAAALAGEGEGGGREGRSLLASWWCRG